MSWFSKVGVFLAPFLVSTTASAQRIYFSGPESVATIATHSLYSRAAVAPIEITLTVPAIDVEQGNDGFAHIAIEGLAPVQSWGNPAVYSAGQLIAVPEGYEPELAIASQDQRELPGVVVKPAQVKYRCHASEPAPFRFNSMLYRSSAVYPPQVAQLEEVGRLQGLRLTRVALNPTQMDMGKKTLKVTTKLVVRVNFRKVREAKTVVLSPTFYHLARTISANGTTLGNTVRADTGPETLMIFTADSYKDTLQPLVDWKRARGLNVEVFSLTQAGGTNDNVKAFIQKYYNVHAAKPTYLLFVGNKDTMPTYMESTANGNAASDMRYALLTGDDHVPDMLYGRIVADSRAEVITQMNRWIAYEKTPDNGSWYPQGLTIASDQSSGNGPSDVQYAEQIQAALKHGTYKNVDGFYQGEGKATAQNISQALDNGRTWLTYIGHGGGTFWASTNGTFDVQTVEGLTNENHLPFLVDVACDNASWVELPKCFGKAWVTQESKGKAAGAVAYYGGSVSVSWDPPAVMAVGISKYHFEKPVHTLGGSVLAGQLYLVEQMGSTDDTLDNLKWFNLFGDPSLLARTDTPKEYTLKQSVEREGDSVIVTVNAVDASGKGVAGLLAAVNSQSTAPLAIGHTDAQGQAQLRLLGVTQLEPNTLLTTTGYNAESHQVALQ